MSEVRENIEIADSPQYGDCIRLLEADNYVLFVDGTRRLQVGFLMFVDDELVTHQNVKLNDWRNMAKNAIPLNGVKYLNDIGFQKPPKG